jgi:hypothetical protein
MGGASVVRKISDVLKDEGRLAALQVLAEQLARQLDECTDPALHLSLSRAFTNVSRAISVAERQAEILAARRLREASIHGVESVERFLADEAGGADVNPPR